MGIQTIICPAPDTRLARLLADKRGPFIYQPSIVIPAAFD
jgi:hypothetical protein